MIFYLENKCGMRLSLTSFGARIMDLWTPDRHGKLDNVVLGFSDESSYEKENPYFGATIGRVANRIANAQFELNNETYTLSSNDGLHTLHGGKVGFDSVEWQGKYLQLGFEKIVEFNYTSTEGEEGFPGQVNATVTFQLSENNELKITYLAKSSKSTPINLTNHSYFNLAGAGRGDIHEHVLQLDADCITAVDDTLIPTGEYKSVENSPFDFRNRRAIGSQFPLGGYDHNFVLSGAKKIILSDPKSGRKLELRTNKPGVQFYSGNFLDGSIAGNGGRYEIHGALCLEPQHFPNFVNTKNFEQMILQPGELYSFVDVYKFSLDQTPA